MLLRHNKRPSSSEECCRHAYKRLRQLEYGDMLVSAEYDNHGLLISGSKSEDNGPLVYEASVVFESSSHCSSANQELQVSEGDHNYCTPNGTSTSTKVTNDTVRSVRTVHIECPGISLKHEGDPHDPEGSSKQELCTDNCVVCNDQGRLTSSEFDKKICDVYEKIPTAGLHDCAPWLEGISSEDGEDLERFTFPGYFDDDFDVPIIRQFEDIRSPICEYPYRKLVAIGPNHQVDIPACEQDTEDNSARWLGTCLVPLPDCKDLVSEVNRERREDCCCSDKGSIRCVRQHVVEAREKQKQTLGEDVSRCLGFCDMGEYVAEKWNEEEGLLFEEVVMSNPVSLARNFWDCLPQYFPTRSCKELVSYYFNVFLVRKRALQNRFDPLHIDSDNDEWQVNDDGESEEDSIVDSPCDGDDIVDEDGRISESEFSESGDSTADASEIRRLYNVARDLYAEGKNRQDHAGHHDFQDDSCTSFEGQQPTGESSGGPSNLQEPQFGLEENKNMNGEYDNDGLSGLNESGRDVDHPCNMKAWDVGYTCGSSKNEDFLPTCNVIEEVFGKAWDENAEGRGVG